MQLLDRRNFMALTGGTALVAGMPRSARAAPSETSVFTADDAGALVDSTLIVGETKAVLIDAQFDVANASRLAEMIAETGRTLETIFITHSHPDHVLGLAVLIDRFPAAKPLTHKLIRPEIEQTAAQTLAFLSGQAPAGTFDDRVVIPEALTADHILLEGERIEILEPMHGDTALISAVHIPALNTLIASDFAYAGTHVWVAENTTPELLAKWRDSLALLEAIGAAVVVPGHRGDGVLNNAGVFGQTRAYLDQWETALASSKSAHDLRSAMLAGNAAPGLSFALERAVAAVYPG